MTIESGAQAEAPGTSEYEILTDEMKDMIEEMEEEHDF